jgi:hypothetical protein
MLLPTYITNPNSHPIPLSGPLIQLCGLGLFRRSKELLPMDRIFGDLLHKNYAACYKIVLI